MGIVPSPETQEGNVVFKKPCYHQDFPFSEDILKFKDTDCPKQRNLSGTIMSKAKVHNENDKDQPAINFSPFYVNNSRFVCGYFLYFSKTNTSICSVNIDNFPYL